MGRHTTYFELRDALAKDGCPICRRAQDAAASFLDGLIYEKVNDIHLREEIRQARGFCNLHASQLRDHGGALGIAIIHRDVLETLLRHIQAAGYQADASWLQSLRRMRTGDGGLPAVEANAGLVRDLLPQAECPACRQRDAMEKRNVETLLEYIDDPELGQALRRSDGLCLPHFRQALNGVADKATYETLVEIQLEAWTRLRDQLKEFVRKQDYRFRDEGLGTESSSWIRAIEQISGMRGLR
jgi:hypothetical protein